MSDRYEGEWVVSALIEDRAERFADRIFVTSHDGDVTYGQTAGSAARFAASLVALGVTPGDRVATMLPSGIDYLAAWFGTAWAGAVEVPINNDYRGEFLGHVLRDSGASVLVVQDRWAERLKGLDVADLKHVIVVGEPVELESHSTMRFAEALGFDPIGAVQRSESDLVYIMYTSGTTGPSKGAMHVNRSALWNSGAWLEILELTSADRAYCMFPLFHVTARSAIVGSTLFAGGSIALRNGFSASGFWDDIRGTGCTFFAYMGAVIHLLHAAAPRPDDGDNAVRIAFGAAAPPEIAADFETRFGFPLIEVYGSTELGVATAPYGPTRRAGTMGVACPHVKLEIQDEHGRRLPPGIEGEIVARPAVPYGIFQGYWRQPEHTVNSWRNLWFHTGDGGRFDDDGFLTFTDRIKDSIRRRGENISSFEVERAVQAHPDILECAAYAVPSELTEDEVMIAVVGHDDAAIDAKAIFEHCVQQIPRFAVPRYLRVMSELPKTPSQRIKKYQLREQGVTDDAVDRETTGIAAPRS